MVLNPQCRTSRKILGIIPILHGESESPNEIARNGFPEEIQWAILHNLTPKKRKS